jgi:hypothetical protein
MLLVLLFRFMTPDEFLVLPYPPFSLPPVLAQLSLPPLLLQLPSEPILDPLLLQLLLQDKLLRTLFLELGLFY